MSNYNVEFARLWYALRYRFGEKALLECVGWAMNNHYNDGPEGIPSLRGTALESVLTEREIGIIESLTVVKQQADEVKKWKDRAEEARDKLQNLNKAGSYSGPSLDETIRYIKRAENSVQELKKRFEETHLIRLYRWDHEGEP